MAIVKTVLTPAVAVVNRTAGHYGIGEVIGLSVQVKPATSNIATFGGITWRRAGGVAGTLTLVNPAAGTATLTLGSTGGTMTLEAWSVNPLAKQATVNITVVAPNDVLFKRVAGGTIEHTQYQASAGFIGEADILPSGVSFANVEVREGSFHGVGSGAFANLNGINHPPGPWAGIVCTAATGNNQWQVYDQVRSGWGAHRTTPQGAPILDLQGRLTYEAASFEWNIPWHYRIVGTVGNGVIFRYMLHKQTVNMAGRVTIKKHNSETCAANWGDPTSTFGLPGIGYP
ncbi:hypothetical protein ABL840_13095 [Variovorax sp. NFACC27]|nr:hypothetical protein SAMN03159371_01587 [Variovorax sp. NFACC28]SEG25887.1 hypothetical protein SAMN03159365_01668 [Variovorax sp. NFACC29]SFC46425.1 hypothetical protein SAMN03159379_02333 [Variovorax sp. NFACC26]SFF92201.1 hypothetical protein SAMN03159447_00909 [Variovorax sp. NFACC27]